MRAHTSPIAHVPPAHAPAPPSGLYTSPSVASSHAPFAPRPRSCTVTCVGKSSLVDDRAAVTRTRAYVTPPSYACANVASTEDPSAFVARARSVFARAVVAADASATSAIARAIARARAPARRRIARACAAASSGTSRRRVDDDDDDGDDDDGDAR